MTDGSDRVSTRRRYLRDGIVATVAGLGGCLGFGGDDSETTEPAATDPGATPSAAAATTTADQGDDPAGTETDASTPTPTATPTPEPLVTLSGTYHGYRGGPGRRAFAPDATTPRSDGTIAYALDLPTAVYQPVVDGTRCYLARRTYEAGEPTVEAFDLRSGSRLWGRDLGASADAAPAVAGDRLVVGTEDGTHALAPDGSVDWETTEGAGGGRPPAVTDEYVFVVGENDVTAFGHDGGRAWGLPFDDRPLAPPAADADAVYVALPRGQRADLVSFDADDGVSRWRESVAVDEGLAPVVAGNTVYATSSLVQGGVTALSASTGDPRWNGDVRAVRAPAVTDDHLVVAGRTTVYAFAREGTLAWELSLGDEIVAGPVAGADTVYVAVRSSSDAIVLLALETTTGESRWSVTTERPLDALPAVVDGGLVAATRDEEAGPERLLVIAAP